MRTRLFWLCCCIVSYLYTTAQPNNNCANAIQITTLNGTCVSGNDNTGATPDIGASSCTVGANQNVWFYFTAQGYSAQIAVNNGPGTPEITIIQFPNAPCVGAEAQEIACSTGSPLTADGVLIPGTTYYVMVAFSNNGYGPYEICINNPIPAPNDNCFTATNITNLNSNCFTSNNNFPSTDILIPSCFTGSTYNVWYSFTAVGVSLDVNIPAGGPGVGQLAVIQFATPCTFAGSVQLGCATGTNNIVLDNVLTIGQQYYIVVGFQNTNFNGNGIGNFDLCIDNPVPVINDDCNSAIVIPNSVLNDPTTCFTTIAGNPLTNDWPSTDVGTFPCWNSNASYNIWYQFVAQGPDVQVTVNPSFSGNEQLALVEFTGAPCQVAGAVLLACANNTILDFNDQLVAGQTYYIAVGFTNNGVGNFCMNVFNPVPPPNDMPCNAITLPTNGNCVDGTTVYANPEGWSVPNPCNPSWANTVWYNISLANQNNVGFIIDLNLDNTPPGMQVSVVLWELTDCSSPGAIAFFHCGAPPSGNLEWGPIDENTIYYLSISTSEPLQTSFDICVSEVPPCFTNDECPQATIINNVQSDQAFVCVPGCNLFADPEDFNNQCEVGNFPAVWFQVNSDNQASLMNIQVTSNTIGAPTISLFQSAGGCNNLIPIGLTSSLLNCVVGSNGEAEAFGTAIGASETYYIVVSSLNSVGGNFQICVNTISQASACVTSRDITIVSRSNGGPLTGPFIPGETVSLCMNVNSYTAAGNNCQWFQGLVPVFGDGWDPASFDGNGQPFNATVNGNPMGQSGNGLYGPSTWDWFTDVDYHHTNFFYQLGDFDGNGTLDMCNILYDPDCPNLGGLTGGCCPPCWGSPQGSILPGGWFAYGINGTCNLPGPPIGYDWGDGNSCGPGMGPWAFCFDLMVRPYPQCLQSSSTMNLMLGFFTFADGEIGTWVGGPSICALDQPAFVTLPMCCNQLDEATEVLDPICSMQQFVYSIDEPDVEFWQWTVSGGGITGGTSGQGGPGTVIINTLINQTGSVGTVTYTFLGFAGGACPVFSKEVSIDVYPAIMVVLNPPVMCATPTTPYVLTPTVTGGNGVYEYLWAPGGESTPSITIPNPVNGTTYRVTVTDAVGCMRVEGVTISVYTTFPVDIMANPLEQCIQEGPIDLNASATGGMSPYSFSWTLPDQSGSSSSSISSTQTGNHVVTVTDTEGCIGRDSVNLTFFGTPEVTITAVQGILAICENQSTELAGVASMGQTPYYYYWNTPDGPEFGKNIIAFTPGIYTITVEDANGCTNTSDIYIDAQPEPYPDLGPNQIVCDDGGTIELTVEPSFVNYVWSTGPQDNGQQTIFVYDAGTYTVTVTNEFGCTGFTDVQVNLFPEPNFPMPAIFEICPGQTITIDVDDYNGPWDYAIWAQCGGCFNTFTTSTPGTYNVAVYDFNGCAVFHQFAIVETNTIDPGLQGDNVICTGEIITLTVDAGYVTYIWSPNPSGSTTNSSSVTSPGTYYVTVIDDIGCSGVDSIEISSGDFVATITGPTQICANVQATLDAGAGYITYLWSTNETTRIIMVEEGSYSVTVTNSFGCQAIATIDIIEAPFVPQITGNDLICTTSESTTLDAGGPYMSYLWSANAGSATTQTISTSLPGTYTVTVVDQSGCIANAAFTVSNHPVPFIAVTGNPNFCVGGTTQLNATSGYVAYEWSTTETTSGITVNAQGPYTVTITDSNGCTNTASMTVNSPYQETVTITGSFVFCPGDQATLAVPGGYASVLWSTGETADQITVNTEGEVSVIVIDADGCIAFDTVMTDENSILSPNITGNGAICDNGTAILNAGPGFDNYIWSHGLGTTQMVTVNMPGTYSVTVSSNSGCFGEDDFTVVGYTSPFAVVTPSATVCDIQEPGGPSTILNFTTFVTAGDMGGAWAQTSGPSPVGLGNPSSVNFNGLNQGTYTFRYTTNSATPPCVEQTYTLTVTVVPCACPVVSLFDAPDLCNDLGAINLNTLLLPQTPTGGTWSIISTPPGANPGTIVPVDRFQAANANPGVYTLQYQVSGLPAYCNDAATVTVNVLRNPTAGMAAAPLQFCAGENEVVNLVSLLIGADNGGMWIETSQFPSTGGAFNQPLGRFTIVNLPPGIYTFDYIIMGPGPCPDDVTTVEIVIEANPVADAGNTATLNCVTPSATLGGNGTSVGANFSYLWTTVDGIVMNEDQRIATATAAGTYILLVTNELTGCTATDQVTIDQVGEFPTDLILLVRSPDCVGDPPGSMQVSAVVGGTAPYTYSLNGAPPVSSPVFNNIPPGDYTIEVTDASGCKIEESFTILPLVVVDLTIVDYVNGDLIFDLGDIVRFSYLFSGSSSTPDSIVWKSKDSIICINCTEIIFEAYLAGVITVEAYDIRGCKITKSISYLVIRKRDVYIPNVFSPNGDNLNDYFTLYTDSDVKEISLLEIYTRWGELVFRKSNFDPNVPQEGWDGTFNGERLNPGVYVYRFEIVYGDGLVDNIAGDVTIIR